MIRVLFICHGKILTRTSNPRFTALSRSNKKILPLIYHFWGRVWNSRKFQITDENVLQSDIQYAIIVEKEERW